MNILEELVSPLTTEEFQQNYFSKTPYAAPFKASRFKNENYWSILEEILASGHDDCWLPRRGLLPNEKELSCGMLTPQQAQEGFKHGRTILVRHAEKAHPVMAGIAKEFSKLFSGAIDIQLYCTPTGEEGFHWHYDIEDVFVLQSHGEKEFYLKPNTSTPKPLPETLPKNLHFEKELSRTELRCQLVAGDWLYIPSGYWHRARAIQTSFHISVGIMNRC